MCFHNGFVGTQVDFFVLDAAPQALDKHIVQSPAFAVHAALYIIVLKYANKDHSGELSTLIGIEYLRGTITINRFFRGIHTKIAVHRVG